MGRHYRRPRFKQDVGPSLSKRCRLRVVIPAGVFATQVGHIIRRQEHHDRLSSAEGRVQHMPYVGGRLSCQPYSLGPLNGCQANGSQESEHRGASFAVTSVYDEDLSRAI